jgi:hypothetical protein
MGLFLALPTKDCVCLREETSSYRYRLGRVQVNIYQPSRGFTQQDTNVLWLTVEVIRKGALSCGETLPVL